MNTAAAPLRLHIQKALGARNRALVPAAAQLRAWAQAAVLPGKVCEASLRLVGAREGLQLNRDFRGRDYATNVLTFVYDDLPAAAPICGDIALCVPVVVREAREQGKTLAAHFAHLLVHGMLHLQGFDHETPAEAEVMEAHEVEILAQLGFADPYRAAA